MQLLPSQPIKQSGSDGAGPYDPATLRGLGPEPDLMWYLLRKKKGIGRFLVNVFGTREPRVIPGPI